MHRDGRLTTVSVPKLLMGTALAHLYEAESAENTDYLPSLEYWEGAHVLSGTRLNSDELYSEFRFDGFQEHGNHLGKVRPKLIERGSL